MTPPRCERCKHATTADGFESRNNGLLCGLFKYRKTEGHVETWINYPVFIARKWATLCSENGTKFEGKE